MTFRSALRRLAAALAISLAAGCAYMETRQGEMIFRPVAGEWSGYRAANVSFEEVSIPVGTNGDHIAAWWSPADKVDAPVLLYLHGARWDLTGSSTRIPRWNRMGFSVLAIDYRGFGKSTPRSPTEQSANEDAEAAWAYLARRAPHAKHFIFGHSLGGAMATQLAIKHPEASGLILEATFTNIPELIKEYPWGFLPLGMLVTQRFDNLDRIDDVKVPVLFAHGTADSVVPFTMSERLYAATTAPKRFFRAEGGNHHNLTAAYFDGYYEAVKAHFHLGTSAPSTADTTSLGTR
jgi:alpha-beta hydrolase superfamily lysophospholipase